MVKFLLISLLTILFSIWLFGTYNMRRYARYISSIEKINDTQNTLVLGAGLKKDNTPTDILADRVVTSIQLIQQGKTQKLIYSGTSQANKYDEPESMKAMALKRGVDSTFIEMDKQGFSTFNSCVNYLNKYSPLNLIIVSQKFHLPRAIFIARGLGLKAIGIPADNYSFSKRKILFWSAREFISLPLNILRLLFFNLISKKKREGLYEKR